MPAMAKTNESIEYSVEEQATDLRWHVLLCEPNQELKAAARLNELGFEAYVPSETLRKIREIRSLGSVFRKPYVMTRPIFPGYLFLLINMAWSFGPIHGVYGLRTGERQNLNPFLKKMNGDYAILSDEDMRKIRQAEDTIRNSVGHGLPYKVGDSVKILEFPDIPARIVRAYRSGKAADVLLDMLGAKRIVKVKIEQVGPV